MKKNKHNCVRLFCDNNRDISMQRLLGTNYLQELYKPFISLSGLALLSLSPLEQESQWLALATGNTTLVLTSSKVKI